MSITNREIRSKEQKTILILALIAWMMLIFYMSHQPGDDSSGMSREVCRAVCRVAIGDFEEMAAPQQEKILDSMEFWIRKGAHCFEYMVLGLLLYLNMAGYTNGRPKRTFWTGLAAGILYAISDELHQSFIPGRSCELRDICIDSLGVLIGVVMTMMMTGKKTKK